MLISRTNLFLLLCLSGMLAACGPEEDQADAYGNFEVTNTIVSTEAAGRLLFLQVSEGQEIASGELVGLIDTSQLHLQKMQLRATMNTLGSKTTDPEPQVEVFAEQKRNLLREKDRVTALLAEKAATPKQLDDINAQIDVIDRQIEAARRQARTVNRGILSEADPLQAQMNVLNEQIRKCYIYNPVAGTVLTKVAEAAEVVGFGHPLYRIASLDTLILRAYVSGDQLGRIRHGQTVTVLVDGSEGQLRPYSGTISWIADQSEFTPKTIQTREERVNLVYAFKVEVPNDGFLKIGMPAEVRFSTSNPAAQ